MKQLLLLFFFITGLVLMNSCQKEISFESSGSLSAGSLQSDGAGDCLPKTIAGSYVEGMILNGDSNYIEVQVNVVQGGSYTINTDTVNGIYFRVTGVFTTAGFSTVRLRGNGTPLIAGIHNFIVTYDSTECAIAITTLPVGTGGTAVFTLDGSPNACLNFVLAGTFTAGTPLTDSNTVTINIDVTTIGTYSISTASINGMTFSGTGTFTATGPQTVILTGNGTPITSGTINIPITVGSSTCSFACNVFPAPVLSDYFPRTANSN